MDYVKLTLLGLVALIAAIASNWGHDLAYQVHAVLIMVIAFAHVYLGSAPHGRARQPPSARSEIYFDGVIRAGVIATAFWGIAGFSGGHVHRVSAGLSRAEF